MGESVRTAAQALGVTLVLAEHTPRQYADAFTVISRARAEALFVGPGPVAYADRALIVDFATRARLPSSFAFRESVELGGLMSYGVSVVDLFRRAATLRGQDPQGRQAWRAARRAADEVRTGHQPQDGEGARDHGAAVVAGAG